MTLCWLLGHVWAVAYTSRALIAYRGDDLARAYKRLLRARFCVCCGAHQLAGAIP